MTGIRELSKSLGASLDEKLAAKALNRPDEGHIMFLNEAVNACDLFVAYMAKNSRYKRKDELLSGVFGVYQGLSEAGKTNLFENDALDQIIKNYKEFSLLRRNDVKTAGAGFAIYTSISLGITLTYALNALTGGSLLSSLDSNKMYSTVLPVIGSAMLLSSILYYSSKKHKTVSAKRAKAKKVSDKFYEILQMCNDRKMV